VPDLPGCVAAVATIQEVQSEIRDAIQFHLDGLKEDGFAGPFQLKYLNKVVEWQIENSKHYFAVT
jgi:predicted RNase H-like HicB family nuclease